MESIKSFVPMPVWTPYSAVEHLLLPDSAQLSTAVHDSTHIPNHLHTMLESADTKFWVVERFWQWLGEQGMSDVWCTAISFVVVCGALALAVWVVDFLIANVLMRFIRYRIQRGKNHISEALYHRKFFTRLFYLIPLGVILIGLETFFRGFTPGLNVAARIITQCVILFTLLLTSFSLLDALNDLYQRSAEAQRRSIKGYIQIAKIILGFFTVILIVADLMQKNPTTLLVGLGAAAAVLSLVFRDTLLGFVASIQLSAQDMVRPGDWIEMPSKHADGIVQDINLTSVKVQNWDNTVTMIPIYSMVSEAFINWRGMETSGGRRFICRFPLDVTSVREADAALIQWLESDPELAPLAHATEELARSSSPQRLTNLALFRAYMEVWLFHNPQLNPKMLTFARYTPEMTDSGVGFEVYAFTKDTESEYVYDAVRRTVVEEVLTHAPLFGLRFFQRPSGEDVRTFADRQEEKAASAEELLQKKQ